MSSYVINNRSNIGYYNITTCDKIGCHIGHNLLLHYIIYIYIYSEHDLTLKLEA